MKRKTDIYHRWVAWSDEDQAYVGRCPDLFFGGVHGDDPIKVAAELQEVIDEWEREMGETAEEWPVVQVRPSAEYV